MTHYSRIADPKKFRKELLVAAREIIVLLSEQKGIDDLRTKKKAIIKDLKKRSNDLRESVKKLDALLPEKELLVKKKEPKKKVLKKEAKIKPDKQISELDRLEYTLGKIESKLKELDG